MWDGTRTKGCFEKKVCQKRKDKDTQGQNRKSLQIYIQRSLGRMQICGIFPILDIAGDRGGADADCTRIRKRSGRQLCVVREGSARMKPI